MYLNSELVREGPCKLYKPKLNYDESTIGCGVQLEYVDKQGYEKIKNCFRGEMGALHFIEVTPKNIAQTHAALAYLSTHVDMDELVHTVSTHATEARKEAKSQASATKDAAGAAGKARAEFLGDTSVIDRIFMHINPKYTGKLSQSKQRLFSYQKSGSKSVIDVFNHVERLYPEARVDHNTSARDVFLNVGGIKMLMPLLYRLAETSGATELHDFVYLSCMKTHRRRNEVATKVIEIIDCAVRLDRSRAAIFFESEEGLLVLRYLFERVRSVLA